MPEAVIVEAVRTPIARGKKIVGELSGVHAADLLAMSYRDLTRHDTDELACESQRRARVAWDEGRFDREVIQVQAPILGEDGETTGAIAIGHPVGSTGARLITSALHELERQDKTTALVSMCGTSLPESGQGSILPTIMSSAAQ